MVHRDLKTQNILHRRTDDGHLFLIGDLGSSKFLDDSMTPGVGNMLYRAPECTGTIYNEKSDVYSYGLIAIEIILPTVDNGDKNKMLEDFRGICANDDAEARYVKMDAKSLPLFALFGKLIRKEPERRPHISTVFETLSNHNGYLINNRNEMFNNQERASSWQDAVGGTFGQQQPPVTPSAAGVNAVVAGVSADVSSVNYSLNRSQKDCYYWRTTGCGHGSKCQYPHREELRGLDLILINARMLSYS